MSNFGKGPPRPPVDGNASSRWRNPGAATGQAPGRSAASLAPVKKPTRRDACAVEESDLSELGDIHELLRALNDAHAGAARIEALVDKVAVLRARCLRRAHKRAPSKIDCTLKEALTLIGNIGLESELLQLLEDLTVLRSELDDKPSASKPR